MLSQPHSRSTVPLRSAAQTSTYMVVWRRRKAHTAYTHYKNNTPYLTYPQLPFYSSICVSSCGLAWWVLWPRPWRCCGPCQRSNFGRLDHRSDSRCNWCARLYETYYSVLHSQSHADNDISGSTFTHKHTLVPTHTSDKHRQSTRCIFLFFSHAHAFSTCTKAIPGFFPLADVIYLWYCH